MAREVALTIPAVTLFSNVNAAIRRKLWEEFPFSSDIVMSEDQEWSRSAILAGHSLVYEPRAAVRHSHNYTLVAAFRRFFDSGVSSERAYMADNAESGKVLRRRALAYGWGELRWLWQTHQRAWIPYAVIYEAAATLAGVGGIIVTRASDHLLRVIDLAGFDHPRVVID